MGDGVTPVADHIAVDFSGIDVVFHIFGILPADTGGWACIHFLHEPLVLCFSVPLNARTKPIVTAVRAWLLERRGPRVRAGLARRHRFRGFRGFRGFYVMSPIRFDAAG